MLAVDWGIPSGIFLRWGGRAQETLQHPLAVIQGASACLQAAATGGSSNGLFALPGPDPGIFRRPTWQRKNAVSLFGPRE